jgi:site-specific recombinase XerD
MTRTNIAIRKARRDFLSSKRNNLKDSSVRAYDSITNDLIEYLESKDIHQIGGIDGYIISQWKAKRKDVDEVSPATLKNNVKHIRVFIRWCESVEMIEEGTADKINVPNISEQAERSDDIVEPEQIRKILDHLEMYEYASRLHAFVALIWHTGCRISALISLDVQDFRPRKGILKVRDRRQDGTALKNGKKSERNITLSDDVVAVLNDYLNGRRIESVDDHNRDPLFTTNNGRMQRQVAYRAFVAISRPCEYGDCPHNRTEQNCEAAQEKKKAYDCPSSGSLHTIRRGAITYHLNNGWPLEKVSERCDVGVPVLKKHYDTRSHEDERQGRNQYVDKL